MLEGIGNDRTLMILLKALNAAAVRQMVISNNIANVDTPGFKRGEVEFESLLRRALEESGLLGLTSSERHIPINSEEEIPEPRLVVEVDQSFREDGNNVDIDAEMAKLSENAITYSLLAHIISVRMEMLRTMINEGRG